MVLEWGCNPVHGFFDLEDGESAGASVGRYGAGGYPAGSHPAAAGPDHVALGLWSDHFTPVAAPGFDQLGCD